MWGESRDTLRICDAALHGDLSSLQSILASDRELSNSTNSQGRTPLSLAAQEGHADVVAALIKSGSKVDSEYQNELGGTALKWAAMRGHTEVAEILLKAGADINKTCRFKWTPLHEAVRSKYPEMMDLLIRRGADVNAVSHNGWTALHVAAADGRIIMVTMLLDAGSRVDVKNAEGHTSATLANQGKHAGVVSLLQADHPVKKLANRDPNWWRTAASRRVTFLDKNGTLTESVGIETLGGVFAPLITRGKKSPAKSLEVFSTASDNQQSIILSLYHGTKEKTSENKFIGKYAITGIRPAQRGQPQIELDLSVSKDGVFISAVDLSTGIILSVTAEDK